MFGLIQEGVEEGWLPQEWDGEAVGKLESNPKKRTIWAWLTLYLTIKVRDDNKKDNQIFRLLTTDFICTDDIDIESCVKHR